MISKIRLLSTTCLIAAILALSGSAVMGQEPPPPVPADDVIGTKCPDKLDFIQYNTYYYRMKDCTTGQLAPYLMGFKVPVQTGCIPAGKCNNTDEDGSISIPNGCATTTNADKGPTFPGPDRIKPIPKEKADSAEVAILPKNDISISGPIYVQVDSTYWVLNKLNVGTYSFFTAVQFTGAPTNKVPSPEIYEFIKNSANKNVAVVKKGSTQGYWIVSE